MNKTIELNTERLYLRPLNIKDAEALFRYRSDSETNKYQGWVPKTIDEAVRFLNNISVEINKNDTWFQLAIVNKTNKEMIGDAGIHFIDEHQAEIGCTLAKGHHGKGYAAEALKSIIDYLFIELNKHRIFCSIDPDNSGAIRLVERLGFRKEAHFRESLFINGKWVDDIIYAILQKEWIEKSAVR